jgi:hypothetical protein
LVSYSKSGELISLISDVLINNRKFTYKSNEDFSKINKITNRCEYSESTWSKDDDFLDDESKDIILSESNIYNFDFANFYMKLFGNSVDYLFNYTDVIVNIGEELKNKYLDNYLNKQTEFYKNVLKHEEKIHRLLEEINLKEMFIKSLIKGQDGSVGKLTLSKISFNEYCTRNNYLNKKEFIDKLSFYMQSFIGKLTDIEIHVKKQLTIVEMIKKSIRIKLDDEKYSRESKLNILFVILTIIQFLVFPIIITNAWFCVNIKFPMKGDDSLVPFGFVVSLITLLPLGQLFIFYKFRNFIL